VLKRAKAHSLGSVKLSMRLISPQIFVCATTLIDTDHQSRSQSSISPVNPLLFLFMIPYRYSSE
jgi:hypothetical protein